MDDEEIERLAIRAAVTFRPVTCPDCGHKWVAPISKEDIEDGVGTSVLCETCLGKRLGMEDD